MRKIKRTVVLKATQSCNLNCIYCYDKRRTAVPSDIRSTEPSKVVRFLSENLPPSEILFCLHGGEPLLIGHNGFSALVSAMREANNKNNHKFRLAVQTNATLIDNRFIRIFKDCSDLFEERGIGVSIDGPRFLNDITRIKYSGSGSSSDIFNGINLLRSAEINFGLLCVVGRHNIDTPSNVYDFLTYLSPGFIRFIPCHDIDNAGNLMRYSISPTEFSLFLISVFRSWLGDTETTIPVDPLVTIIGNISGNIASWCEYERMSKCSGFVLIDYNGGLACCDNWGIEGTRPEYKSIYKMQPESILEFFRNPASGSSIHALSSNLLRKCHECPVFNVCNGGCLATRNQLEIDINLAKDYCNAKKLIIQEVQQQIVNIRRSS